MEKSKTSKKALRGLINDSMQEALKGLELPEPGKKAKKLIRNNSRKLATLFADVIKREDKKKRKAAKFMERSVKGKARKSQKTKTVALEKENLETA